MRPVLSIAMLLATSVFAPTTLSAANNAAGTARLSWDEFVTMTNVDSLPTNPAPLYLLLNGAPDVRSLAVDFRWSPNDQFGPGYHVETLPPSHGTCGVMKATNPGGDFDGDTTYTWSIIFPEGSTDHSCVIYNVGSLQGGMSTFSLTSVKTKDAAGNIDNLAIHGDATIGGGLRAVEDTLSLIAIAPQVASAGQKITVLVLGDNFRPGTTVSFVSQDVLIKAKVNTLGPECITASLQIPQLVPEHLDVIVASPDGTSDSLVSALTVVGSHRAYVPQHVVVQFRPAYVTVTDRSEPVSVSMLDVVDEDLRTRLSALGVQSMAMLTPTATRENLIGHDSHGNTIPLDLAQLDYFVLTLPDTNVMTAVANLRADTAHVVRADPDWLGYASSIPNDPLFGRQWYLYNTQQFGGSVGEDARVTGMWDLTEDPSAPIVILDSGIDVNHPEFTGRVVLGPNYIGTGPPIDDSGHGTAVAGIIGAARDNAGGIAGINSAATLVVVKVQAADGSVPGSALAAGIDWARTNGYAIVNISSAANYRDGAVGMACKNAFWSAISVFASVGNENLDTISFPAGFSSTVAVGASFADGLRWDEHGINWSLYGMSGPPGGYYHGSNWGPHVDVLAPGGNFIETTTPGGYEMIYPGPGGVGFTGVSAAVPVVTGIASVLGGSGVPTGDILGFYLKHTARDIVGPSPPYAPGWDDRSGYGIVSGEGAFELYLEGRSQTQAGVGPGAGIDVSSSAGFFVSILDWPGIPPNRYNAVRHTIQSPPMPWLKQNFRETPLAFTERMYSNGTSAEEAATVSSSWWVPNAWVTNVTRTDVTMQTYVYDLSYPGLGHVGWFPTTPGGIRFAAIGLGFEGVLDVQGTVEKGVALRTLENPMRDKLSLVLTTGCAGEAELAVFDVVGRRVASVAPHNIGPGRHVYRLQVSRELRGKPAPGVYLARGRVNGAVVTARLVVLE